MRYISHISGLELTKFRMDKGLSQSQLCSILGVSVVTIKSWEHERRNVPMSINNFIRLSLSSVPGDKLIEISKKISNVNQSL